MNFIFGKYTNDPNMTRLQFNYFFILLKANLDYNVFVIIVIVFIRVIDYGYNSIDCFLLSYVNNARHYIDFFILIVVFFKTKKNLFFTFILHSFLTIHIKFYKKKKKEYDY